MTARFRLARSQILRLGVHIAWLCPLVLGHSAPLVVGQYYSATNLSQIVTDGPAVYSVWSYTRTNILPSTWSSRPPPPDFLPKDVRERWMMQNTQTVAQVWYCTNKTFDHFQPTSLNYLIWTNFIAHTNNRSTVIWSQRMHPPDWPSVPPVVTWNTNCLMWGMKGLTALSPCWESEGYSGQVPITALTRRHGYTRGHSMGPDGFETRRAGQKIWFVTLDNQLVEVRVKREVVRTMAQAKRDYTIILFDRDLPGSVTPLRVTDWKIISGPYRLCADAPCPIFETEQGGNVSAQVEGFKVPVLKGGDSGSPDLIPLPGELIFYSGRTTSGPSAEMQADMDELCRREGLDPSPYQLRWVDLDKVKPGGS